MWLSVVVGGEGRVEHAYHYVLNLCHRKAEPSTDSEENANSGKKKEIIKILQLHGTFTPKMYKSSSNKPSEISIQGLIFS